LIRAPLLLDAVLQSLAGGMPARSKSFKSDTAPELPVFGLL